MLQCAFDNESDESCRRCQQHGVACTFLTDRKPRGPPSRRVAEARLRASTTTPSASGSDAVPAPLPAVVIGVTHFVPEPIFHAIIEDYILRVYPVLPLIHVPTFKTLLETRAFETDPGFLRLCISLCAVTVASIPRNLARYGLTWYADAAELVDKASHLVLLSRIATTPEWQNNATVESMIVSIVLSLASHYAAKPNAGWAYASEAVLFFRELELFKRGAYNGLSPVDTELCKRAFWILFIIQM